MAYTPQQWANDNIASPYGPINATRLNYIESGVQSASYGVLGSSALIRYVDYANGSDSNAGLGPSNAFKTIQAAYNDLKTYAEANLSSGPSSVLGVGTIIALPGRHDVGTGFTQANRRPCLLRGYRSGASADYIGGSATVIYSSGTATELVYINGGSSLQSFGHEFEDLVFELGSSQTAGVRLNSVNRPRFERCVFRQGNEVSRAVPGVSVQNDAGGDGSWGKMINCQANDMGLFSVSNTAGGQFNYWVFRDSTISMGASATYGISANAAVGVIACSFRDIYVEGPNTGAGPALLMRNFYNNVIDNVYGEHRDPSWPFLDIGGNGNRIVGGRCTRNSTGTDGIYLKINGSPNVIDCPFLKNVTDSTTSSIKDRLSDVTSTSKNDVRGGEWSDRNKGFVDISVSTTPANPDALGKRRLFNDSGTDKLSVRSSGGTTILLEP